MESMGESKDLPQPPLSQHMTMRRRVQESSDEQQEGTRGLETHLEPSGVFFYFYLLLLLLFILLLIRYSFAK
jgi:hypothetical protein